MSVSVATRMIRPVSEMTDTDIYFLAARARGKLTREASRGDHNLRMLVSHANMLDSLMDRLSKNRDERQRKRQEQAREQRRLAEEHHPMQQAKPIPTRLNIQATVEEDEEEVSQQGGVQASQELHVTFNLPTTTPSRTSDDSNSRNQQHLTFVESIVEEDEEDAGSDSSSLSSSSSDYSDSDSESDEEEDEDYTVYETSSGSYEFLSGTQVTDRMPVIREEEELEQQEEMQLSNEIEKDEEDGYELKRQEELNDEHEQPSLCYSSSDSEEEEEEVEEAYNYVDMNAFTIEKLEAEDVGLGMQFTKAPRLIGV